MAENKVTKELEKMTICDDKVHGPISTYVSFIRSYDYFYYYPREPAQVSPHT